MNENKNKFMGVERLEANNENRIKNVTKGKST